MNSFLYAPYRSTFIKRLLDFCAALFGLFVLSPIFVILAFQIRFKLGSPVLFRQARSGLHGRPFLMVKFRTMRDAFGPDGQPLPDADRTTTLTFTRELTNYLSFECAEGRYELGCPRPLLT